MALAADSEWMTGNTETMLEQAGWKLIGHTGTAVHNPLLMGYLRLPNPAACFHGFAEVLECTLLGWQLRVLP